MTKDLVFKKDIDWSLLYEGFTIPKEQKIHIYDCLEKKLNRGESCEVVFLIEDKEFIVTLKNQNIDSNLNKRSDLLQIRYNHSSKIAEFFRKFYAETVKDISKLIEEGFSKQSAIGKTKNIEKIEIYSTDKLNTFRIKCIKQGVWIIPSNKKYYDSHSALDDLKVIDWQQTRSIKNIEVNDLVYMYSAKPDKFICNKCIVNKTNIQSKEINDYIYTTDKANYNVGPFVELQCLESYEECDSLKFKTFASIGVKGNIQSSLRLNKNQIKYFESVVAKNKGLVKTIFDIKDRELLSEEELINLPFDDLELKAKQKSLDNKSKIKTVVSKTYYRDQYIAEYTKRKAKGICQLCGKNAPFNDSKGRPYLESHHIIWLSDGGEDSIENTVALCPNCHRKMHVVNDKKDIEFLKKK